MKLYFILKSKSLIFMHDIIRRKIVFVKKKFAYLVFFHNKNVFLHLKY